MKNLHITIDGPLEEIVGKAYLKRLLKLPESDRDRILIEELLSTLTNFMVVDTTIVDININII